MTIQTTTSIDTSTSARLGPGALLRAIDKPWLILGCAVPLAILSQFYRSSNGVIAPDLMQELSLTADDIGVLSGSFFIVFAALQIPIGLLLDRWGPRNVVSGMLTLAVLGSLVFAFSSTMTGLAAGRFMIGVGFAALMVGSLVVLSRWFPSDRFGSAMSFLFASSNLGSLVATLPLAAAAAAWGWRPTFVVLGLLTAGLAILYFLVVRDAPRDHPCHDQKPESFGEMLAGLWEVWKLPGVGLIMPLIAVGYASVIAVLGLWGGPFLHEVHGLDGVARGNVLSIMAVAMIAGTLAYGPIDRRCRNRRLVVTVGSCGTIGTLVALAMWPAAPLWQITVLLSLFSFIGSYSLVVMAHGMTLFPDALKGRGITTLNTALMGGAAVMQVATGALIGAFPDRTGPNAAMPYGLLFLSIAVATGIALLVYRRIPAPEVTRNLADPRDAGAVIQPSKA